MHTGSWTIHYGTSSSGAMFAFKDGELTYIEIMADDSEDE